MRRGSEVQESSTLSGTASAPEDIIDNCDHARVYKRIKHGDGPIGHVADNRRGQHSFDCQLPHLP